MCRQPPGSTGYASVAAALHGSCQLFHQLCGNSLGHSCELCHTDVHGTAGASNLYKSGDHLCNRTGAWVQGMLDNFPEYIDCQLRLAAIAARGGKRDEALNHLRAVLKQKPGNADALAFMGAVPSNSSVHYVVLMSPRDNAKHLPCWINSSSCRPRRCDLPAAHAAVHAIFTMDTSKVAEPLWSRRHCQRVHAVHPAGQLHFEAREYSEAGEAWEQLVAGREERDDAYARLGLANLQLISVQTDSNKVPCFPHLFPVLFPCLTVATFTAYQRFTVLMPGQGSSYELPNCNMCLLFVHKHLGTCRTLPGPSGKRVWRRPSSCTATF